MIYIQISEKHDAKGFLKLAKSGTPVYCLPKNTYGVQADHIKILKREGVPFKKLDPRHVSLPKSALVA